MSKESLDQAAALAQAGQFDDALAITGRLLRLPGPAARAYGLHGVSLRAAGRLEEALENDRRAVAVHPQVGPLWRNLAATLGDLGRGPESVEAMEKAFALGVDGAANWGVMARARLACGDLAGAEQAYRTGLKQEPANESLSNELADLLWMRDGDIDAAQQVFDRAYLGGGRPAPLLIAKAKMFKAAGETERAAQLLGAGVERIGDDIPLLMAAAQGAVETGRLDLAERWALAADRLAGGAAYTLNQLAIVYLAQGRAAEALDLCRRGLEADPQNQSLWGWAATAARAAGDRLYGELYDYERMVRVYDIETPDGWADLGAYLKDLAATLHRLHVLNQHPSAQSFRHGSQTPYLLTGSDEPALRAFFAAVDKPIREHIAGLGRGDDPLRRRSAGDYRIAGAWSVRLKPGGFHQDHFHPEGWISSAFYVETPETALDSDERQGWIRFGQPPFPTSPALPPEHYVRPKPGRLALFPSYMWHGTVPFTTDERRLTIAFDAVPRMGRPG